jgi:hypothetical protein
MSNSRKLSYVELVARAQNYVRNAPRWKSQSNEEAETTACLLIRELCAALAQQAQPERPTPGVCNCTPRIAAEHASWCMALRISGSAFRSSLHDDR